jgi:hypothetical protein
MAFRSDGLAVAISFMLLGCAVNPYASRAGLAIQRVFPDKDDSRLWRTQKERQQRIAREAGRIGYIGNAGPALGSTVPSSTF